ncbi:hypothetical protein D3C84_763000 [compost metagenome]
MRGIQRIRPAPHRWWFYVTGVSQQEQPQPWRNQTSGNGRHGHVITQSNGVIKHLPLIGGQTHQPGKQREIPGTMDDPKQHQRQQHTEKTEHHSLRKKRRQQQGAHRQQARLKRRLLPAARHQQAKDKGRQHVKRVGIGNEHPVGDFAERAKEQQPAQIAPLSIALLRRLSRQVHRHCQTKPRKRQTTRHIQQIDGVTDISQVIEHHTQ